MTSEVTQAALEPCPFCGGNAKVDDEESDDVGGYFASCTKCPVSAWGDTREEAIAAWNTRLTAQSGEGRSGAGEEVFAAALEELDRECRCAKVRGEDGRRVGVAVLRKHFGPALLLQQSEFAPLTNTALRAALNARQSGEGEREALRDALDAAHFYIDASPDELADLGITRDDALRMARDKRAALRATDDAGGAK